MHLLSAIMPLAGVPIVWHLRDFRGSRRPRASLRVPARKGRSARGSPSWRSRRSVAEARDPRARAGRRHGGLQRDRHRRVRARRRSRPTWTRWPACLRRQRLRASCASGLCRDVRPLEGERGAVPRCRGAAPSAPAHGPLGGRRRCCLPTSSAGERTRRTPRMILGGGSFARGSRRAGSPASRGLCRSRRRRSEAPAARSTSSSTRARLARSRSAGRSPRPWRAGARW